MSESINLKMILEGAGCYTHTWASPSIYNSLWEIIRQVAEGESTYYNDNDGRVYCPFCPAQKDIPPYEVTHTPDCIVTKARELMEWRKALPRVEIKIEDSEEGPRD